MNTHAAIAALEKAIMRLTAYGDNNTNYLREAREYLCKLDLENEEKEKALKFLIKAKKFKEEHGKNEMYLQMKETAWNVAYNVIKKPQEEKK